MKIMYSIKHDESRKCWHLIIYLKEKKTNLFDIPPTAFLEVNIIELFSFFQFSGCLYGYLKYFWLDNIRTSLEYFIFFISVYRFYVISLLTIRNWQCNRRQKSKSFYFCSYTQKFNFDHVW